MTESRQARSARYQALAAAALARTKQGQPAMVTTTGLVVPTGWSTR